MSYYIYRTEAIILSTKNIGESGKFFSLLTPELGRIGAQALGVRALTSKLKFHLAYPALLFVELIRGKEYFRLTGVTTELSFRMAFASAPTRIFATRLLRFTLRMVHGEEKNKELFYVYRDTLEMLSKDIWTKEETALLEILAMVKILSLLGYHPEGDSLLSLNKLPLSRASLSLVRPLQKEAVRAINDALHASNL